jgi:hypothetical protein
LNDRGVTLILENLGRVKDDPNLQNQIRDLARSFYDFHSRPYEINPAQVERAEDGTLVEDLEEGRLIRDGG